MDEQDGSITLTADEKKWLTVIIRWSIEITDYLHSERHQFQHDHNHMREITTPLYQKWFSSGITEGVDYDW